MESLLALRRENKEKLGASMVKDTMKRKKPSFNETYHGYRTFSELLLDAQKEGLLELEIDGRSRTYVVTRFGEELKETDVAVEPLMQKRKRRRRSRPRANGEVRSRSSAKPAAQAGRVRATAPQLRLHAGHTAEW